MPPVEEIDEFDDDVSHLDTCLRNLLYTTQCAHFLLQAATNSVIAAAAANSVVAAPIHWCWSFYSSSKKIKAPVCGARRPRSGAPGAPRLAPVWGARRTSGAPAAPSLSRQAPPIWRPPSGARLGRQANF
ncbi:hypothetical protein TIFTF001_023800 [Ficus carica]|uniref:Uncharacterized protein n=1 Tax=Ficus carica TaxID=3494 RepID=A0AA88AGW8_FICCA|nr:hypothetical protein TIFTF001_023800 [Ficus carica]